MPISSVIADAVTTPYQAVVQAGVSKGDLVVVNGVGGVGGYTAQIATAFGGTVIAVDVNDDKLKAIAGNGAALTLNARQTTPLTLERPLQVSPRSAGCGRPNGSSLNVPARASARKMHSVCSIRAPRFAWSACTMDKVEIRLSNLMAYHARAIGNWGCAPGSIRRRLSLS